MTMTNIESTKQQHPNAYKRWDVADDTLLADQFTKGVPIFQLASQFHRQPSAINARLAKLGLVESQYPPPKPKKAEPELATNYDRRVLIVVQSFCESYQRIFSEPHWAAQNLAADLARGTAHKCKLLGEFCGLLAWLTRKKRGDSHP